MRIRNNESLWIFALVATMPAACMTTLPVEEQAMGMDLDGESAHVELIEASGTGDPDPGKAKLQFCNDLVTSTGLGAPFVVQCGSLSFPVGSGECGECQHVMVGDWECELYLSGATPLLAFDLSLEDRQQLALVIASEVSGEVVLEEDLPDCALPDGTGGDG